jgi:hypothetical protein
MGYTFWIGEGGRVEGREEKRKVEVKEEEGGRVQLTREEEVGVREIEEE